MNTTRTSKRRLVAILRLDAAASLVLAGIGFGASGWLSDGVGLTETWPVLATATFLAVYGIEQVIVSRRPTASLVAGLVAIDGVFALAMVALALADPFGADPWWRAAMAGLGLTVGVLGILKRRFSRPTAWDLVETKQTPATAHRGSK